MKSVQPKKCKNETLQFLNFVTAIYGAGVRYMLDLAIRFTVVLVTVHRIA
jgi:hypothetical protein